MCEVAIIHPDLGIGGAERLIIDVAKAIQTEHPVSIWTSRYEKDRAFEDCATFPIHVHGSLIPRHIFGFLHILFALLKSLYLIIVFAIKSKAEIVIMDQLSAWIPILRILRPNVKILFYCHFPDLLLAPRGSRIRKFYRLPFDFLEKNGISKAHVVLVNSKFTAGKVKEVLEFENVDIVYPCVEFRQVSRKRPNEPVFVSINRYERKKNHQLAIEALAIVRQKYPTAQLVIAGGYDPHVLENVEHQTELEAAAVKHEVQNHVTFLRNITDARKWELMATSTAVIYTPQNEHFGIVPIEALSVGTPVIACNSGGPLETANCEGCKLCEPEAEEFARAMIEVYEDNTDRSEALKEHAHKFGFEKFTKKWLSLCDEVYGV